MIFGGQNFLVEAVHAMILNKIKNKICIITLIVSIPELHTKNFLYKWDMRGAIALASRQPWSS